MERMKVFKTSTDEFFSTKRAGDSINLSKHKSNEFVHIALQTGGNNCNIIH